MWRMAVLPQIQANGPSGWQRHWLSSPNTNTLVPPG